MGNKTKKYEGGVFNNKGKRPTVCVVEKAQTVLVQFRVFIRSTPTIVICINSSIF